MSLKIVPWISPSALASFSDCRLQWKWNYVDGYRSLGRIAHFDLGSGIHHGLAEMYQNEADPVRAFNEWIDAQIAVTQGYMDEGGPDIARALVSDIATLEESRELGSSMLEQYVKHFNEDQLEVIAVEQRLERPIPGTDGWMLPAIIDVLVRHHNRRGRLYVMEHKTFSRFEEWFLYKDHQFVAEKWVAESITDGEPVAGVLYNGLRKAFPDRTKSNLFERRIIDVNEAQVKTLLKRLRGMYKQITSGLSIYPEPGLFKCRNCPYKEPCDLLMRGEDYQEYLDLMYTTREDRYESGDASEEA